LIQFNLIRACESVFISAKEAMFSPVSHSLFVREQDYMKSFQAIVGLWTTIIGKAR